MIPCNEVHAKVRENIEGDAEHSQYTVIFEEGPMGIGLILPDGAAVGTKVMIVRENTQASETGIIEVGDTVLYVGGVDVTHLDHTETVDVMRSCKRPLEIVFEKPKPDGGAVGNTNTIARSEMHDILFAYFLSHDEEKCDHIDDLLNHFEGSYHTLAHKLENRYGFPLDIDAHKTNYVAKAHFDHAKSNLQSNIAVLHLREDADAKQAKEKKKAERAARKRNKLFNDRQKQRIDMEANLKEVDLEASMTWGPMKPDNFRKSLFRNQRGVSPRTRRVLRHGSGYGQKSLYKNMNTF